MNALPQHLTDDQFSAYLDGQLPAGEQARIDAHLAACPACATELRAWRATVGLLRELPPAPLPRAFTIPANARPQPSWWDRLVQGRGYRALQGATALAAMLLLTLCGGDLLLQAPPVGMPVALAPAPEVMSSPAAEQTFGLVAATDTPATTGRQAMAPTRAPEASPEALAQSAAPSTATPPLPGPVVQSTTAPAPAGATPPAKAAGGNAAPSPTPPHEEREAPTAEPPGAEAALTPTPLPSPTAARPEVDTASRVTQTPGATALAYTSQPSPAPQPGEPARAAPTPRPAWRLAVCGVEGALLLVVVGLALVTGRAWLARR